MEKEQEQTDIVATEKAKNSLMRVLLDQMQSSTTYTFEEFKTLLKGKLKKEPVLSYFNSSAIDHPNAFARVLNSWNAIVNECIDSPNNTQTLTEQYNIVKGNKNISDIPTYIAANDKAFTNITTLVNSRINTAYQAYAIIENLPSRGVISSTYQNIVDKNIEPFSYIGTYAQQKLTENLSNIIGNSSDALNSAKALEENKYTLLEITEMKWYTDGKTTLNEHINDLQQFLTANKATLDDPTSDYANTYRELISIITYYDELSCIEYLAYRNTNKTTGKTELVPCYDYNLMPDLIEVVTNKYSTEQICDRLEAINKQNLDTINDDTVKKFLDNSAPTLKEFSKLPKKAQDHIVNKRASVLKKYLFSSSGSIPLQLNAQHPVIPSQSIGVTSKKWIFRKIDWIIGAIISILTFIGISLMFPLFTHNETVQKQNV
ncbi:hypothetical protein NEOKW01_0050 [Nematocida sp. AWRm80]|nr:hypothetical protein NEOKW01_0050 [Nematocida sp. AWRm80]